MQFFEYITRITLILLALVVTPSQVTAAELLMVEQPHCPYCDRFNEEIGGFYAKTDEGKRAPLVRLQMHEAWPEQYSKVKQASFTPTFILVHEGEEVGRLNGYQGDEFFWFLLGEMLMNLPADDK